VKSTLTLKQQPKAFSYIIGRYMERLEPVMKIFEEKLSCLAA